MWRNIRKYVIKSFNQEPLPLFLYSDPGLLLENPHHQHYKQRTSCFHGDAMQYLLTISSASQTHNHCYSGCWRLIWNIKIPPPSLNEKFHFSDVSKNVINIKSQEWLDGYKYNLKSISNRRVMKCHKMYIPASVYLPQVDNSIQSAAKKITSKLLHSIRGIKINIFPSFRSKIYKR